MTMTSILFSIIFYPLLAAIGFYCLWVRMLKNGAADEINNAVRTKRLPDGTRLTALPFFDRILGKSLAAQIVFYDAVTDGRREAHRLLLSTLHPQIQVILSFMILQASKKGQSWWLSDFTFPLWNVLNLGWGSAVVFPLYMLTSLCVQATTGRAAANLKPQMHPVDLWSAVIVTLSGLFLPLVLLYPRSGPHAREKRHRGIASHRLAITVLSLCRPMVRLLVTSLWSSGLVSTDVDWLRASLYGILIVYGAFFHVRTLLLSMLRGGNVFLQVFSPWHEDSAIQNERLSVAVHQFLQYDLLIINLAAIPFYVQYTGKSTWEAIAANLALGPGAAVILSQFKS